MTELPLFDELEAKVRHLVEEIRLMKERKEKAAPVDTASRNKLLLIEEKIQKIIKLIEQL